MEDFGLTLSPSAAKPAVSAFDTSQRSVDATSAIQQADVSSSRPALLAQDALGPLLFEALDGFFFTINHNFEFDSVSDNVGQYLKYSQEELAGRSLYHCVHPSDIGEFSKAWAKKGAGDPSNTLASNEQSRGRTFLCRMRTNDEATPYVRMIVSATVHRDSAGSEKTFLICIARRPSLNDPKDKPSLLGFDQFSSRINLNYDMENLDSSHMKCEAIDMNFLGKNFRDYVYSHDIPMVERHFQEVLEKGEAKSSVYRFCLHDDIYAFINTRSKLFQNTTTGQCDSILSTHTIIRLIESAQDLNGNASTRLMKSIITSNRDLQRSKQQQQQQQAQHPTPPKPASTSPTTPIGTQFALTMLGMHKNASNSLQQHISSTLGTLAQVQHSLSVPATSSPNDRGQNQLTASPSPSPTHSRLIAQKSTTLDSVSSSDTVEFGSKRATFSPSLGSVHSNHGSLSSPVNSFDIFFSSPPPATTNGNDLSGLLPSPMNHKPGSPLFSNHDTYMTASSPRPGPPGSHNPVRSSKRLRQLLANKSPPANENPSKILHYRPDVKLEDLVQGPESPTTTHSSPATGKHRRKSITSQNHGSSATGTNPAANNGSSAADLLLKQLLRRQNSTATSPIKAESNHSDDSSSGAPSTNKQRSDIFLRTLLNDEIPPQKVIAEAPFTINSRNRFARRSSSNTNSALDTNPSGSGNARVPLKSQLSMQLNSAGDSWENKMKTKKSKAFSNTFENPAHAQAKKSGKAKRETDYLSGAFNCQTPQSVLSDGSLDALLDSSLDFEQSSPMTLRRTTRHLSGSNSSATPQAKRPLDNEECLQSARKHPKLLQQALQKDVKMEYQDHAVISPSTAVAATRQLNQSPQHPKIKTEPEIYDHISPYTKTPPIGQSPLRRPNPNAPSTNSQSTLLRSLIRTPQTPSTAMRKDAPLYQLLQSLDQTTTVSSNENALLAEMNASIDPLEQYLTPVLSQTPAKPAVSSKDDYLAALLSSDPQQPNEISFVPSSKPQTSNESTRINAIANDLLNSTAQATSNNSNEDFLSLLYNKDFLECLNESTAIDSILLQNSTNLMEQTFLSKKRTEKDEKAISEIYNSLVTSLNPGPPQLPSTMDSSLIDNDPFSSLTGDTLFADASSRTVNSDPMPPMYRLPPAAPPPNTYAYPPNNTQFADGFSMDLLDNSESFPPNVTLSPMSNTYPTAPNPGMTYPQQSQPHMPHHRPPNPLYRQQSQPPMYNNYPQPPPNQMPPGYYPMPPPGPSMQQQQQQQQQQRMSPANHPSAQMAKRQALLHHHQQRSSTPVNQQQLQLHMSMNVTLPHMASNHHQQPPPQQQGPPPPQQQLAHRPMPNVYNEMMMPNNGGPQMQPDYHQYPPNNTLDLPYGPDLFMSPSPNMGQQPLPNRHANVLQYQPAPPQPPPLPSSHLQAPMHQPYSNMSVALSATIQQNSHNPNNLMNSPLPNLTPAECRQSEELNNQMMSCLSFQPSRCTSEFVRKQLQNTIHGRQKPVGGKDLSGHNSLSANLESNQKGAYFRSQLSSPMSTPPLQNTMRTPQQQQQQQQQQGKTG